MLASAPRLIRLTSPDRKLDRELLHARGGFAWWYLDALDDNGDGLTAIWSFGLPFLPGYESRARAGDPQAPRERPSLNLVAYRGGEEAFYLLQEYPEPDAEWSASGEEWRFGDTTIRSYVEAGRRKVEMALDCPLPGTRDRLRGWVELDGVSRASAPFAPTTVRDHDWSPLTGPSRARARLDVGGRELLHLRGRGYHDRNGSSTSFSSLGIDHWIWGRVPAGDRELIYYLLWPTDDGPPEAIGLEIGAHGETIEVPLTVQLKDRRRGRYGMPYWGRVDLMMATQRWLTVRHRAPVDDGPFYLRCFTDVTTLEGSEHVGTGELVRPDRVDLAPLRRFVDMRVHHTESPRSRFNALFSGERTGRLRRQLGELLSLPNGPAHAV